jgi:hypothetical protein
MHQVAVYLLDWDVMGGGRAERVDIIDTNGNLLDSRMAAGFSNGVYLVWNLSGHVTLRFTTTNANANVVVSGLFFGGGTGNSFGSAAAFVKSDATTGGSWQTGYGADGYNVTNDSAKYPSYVRVTPLSGQSYTWVPSTSDVRATQKGSASDRIAACWYSDVSFSIDFSFADANMHQVAVYLLDWDVMGGGRAERVDIIDTNGNLLDSRTAAGFSNGVYLVWNLSGHVTLRFTTTNANANVVVSGLFFGGRGFL